MTSVQRVASSGLHRHVLLNHISPLIVLRDQGCRKRRRTAVYIRIHVITNQLQRIGKRNCVFAFLSFNVRLRLPLETVDIGAHRARNPCCRRIVEARKDATERLLVSFVFEGLGSGRRSDVHHCLPLFGHFQPLLTAGSVLPYNVMATDAGPRASLTPSTSTSKSPPSVLLRNASLTRTSRAGLAAWPLDGTLPNSQARDSKAQVLKNLAAQSHLSLRTL